MNCRKIITLLGPYLDGECTPEERRKVDKHLRQCPACRSELELLGRIEAGSRRLIQPDPGEDYWTSFLPKVRQRIDRDRPQQMPVGFVKRIKRLFAPPAPWFRLAGAVATAVLVVVIGRAFIGQKDDLVPVRSPADRPPTDQVRPAGRDTEGSSFAVDSITADREKRIRTAPVEEASGKKGMGIPPDEETLAEKEAKTTPGEETARAKEIRTAPAGGVSETSAEKSQAIETPAVHGETPPGTAPDTDRLPVEEKIEEVHSNLADTEASEERENKLKTAVMARSAADRDWRDQIQYWQAIIASLPDESTLATAHLSLAESWYQVAVSSTDPDDVSAALRVQRAALEFATEDSTRQRLQDRISALEDRQQKK